MRRHGVGTFRPEHALGPERAVRPAMDLANLADRAVGDHLLQIAGPVAHGRSGGHLRGDARLAGGLGERAGLVDGPRERLDAQDVLAPPDRVHAYHGVRVVRRGHEHRVDVVVLLVEHLAVVAIPLCLRIFLEYRLGVPLVDVT